VRGLQHDPGHRVVDAAAHPLKLQPQKIVWYSLACHMKMAGVQP
jgi:hypothetical protein